MFCQSHMPIRFPGSLTRWYQMPKHSSTSVSFHTARHFQVSKLSVSTVSNLEFYAQSTITVISGRQLAWLYAKDVRVSEQGYQKWHCMSTGPVVHNVVDYYHNSKFETKSLMIWKQWCTALLLFSSLTVSFR